MNYLRQGSIRSSKNGDRGSLRAQRASVTPGRTNDRSISNWEGPATWTFNLLKNFSAIEWVVYPILLRGDRCLERRLQCLSQGGRSTVFVICPSKEPAAGIFGLGIILKILISFSRTMRSTSFLLGLK
jgi:hypothetical protein